MISGAAADRLLGELCIRLGFCLPARERSVIRERPPESPDEFAVAVIRAEGLDPDLLDSHVYRQVLSEVSAAYEEELAAQEALLSTEPSGVLFEVEHVATGGSGHLMCRQLDSRSFSLERTSLNGYRVLPGLTQPRALYQSGAPRLDLFIFHLEKKADIRMFRVGQLVLLTENASDRRGAG